MSQEQENDPQGGLSDQEFACFVMRSCGVPVRKLAGALGQRHAEVCRFCQSDLSASSLSQGGK